MQRDDKGEWFCLGCADAWLKEFVASKTRGTSLGGLALPAGITDDRRVAPSFKDLIPNRAARRRAR